MARSFMSALPCPKARGALPCPKAPHNNLQWVPVLSSGAPCLHIKIQHCSLNTQPLPLMSKTRNSLKTTPACSHLMPAGAWVAEAQPGASLSS